MIAWVDIETTGLDPKEDYLLEVAVVITGDYLEHIDTKSIVMSASPEQLMERLQEDVLEMHTNNNLINAVLHPDTPSLEQAHVELVDWFKSRVGNQKLPMAGSSVQFDRAFLQVHMPEFESLFHYRNIDISTLKELRSLWRPDIPKYTSIKGSKHRALDDIHSTLAEAQHYRDLWLVK